MSLSDGTHGGNMFKDVSKFTQWAISFLILLSNALGPGAQGSYISDVQWTVGVRVSQYSSYKDVSLLTINIPRHTQKVFLSFRAASSPANCDVRNVTVYLQPGGLPVISPYNETFPEHFHLPGGQGHEYHVASSNASHNIVIVSPRAGTWFVAAIMKQYSSEDIRQAGFSKQCHYSMSMVALSEMLVAVRQISMEDTHKIHLGLDSNRLFQYTVPDYTVQYSIQVSNCEVTDGNTTKQISPCPLTLTFSEVVVPSNSSITVNCSEHNSTCSHGVLSPVVLQPSYVMVTRNMAATSVLSFTLHFSSSECKRVKILEDIDYVGTTDGIFRYHPHEPRTGVHQANCLTPNSLGKYKLSAIDFSGVYVMPGFSLIPIVENQMFVPDELSITTDFFIDPMEDMGGTLKISLAVLQNGQHLKQGSQIWLCIMKSRVPYKTSLVDCPEGVLMTVNTSSEASSLAIQYFPYPESGRWYMSFQSICYNSNSTRDTWESEKCLVAPMVQFMVTLAPCLEEGCGRYGSCKEFISGVHIYSSCDCFAGWRGYGCTDGTHANPDSAELTAVLLLSLSNLFFIPAILVATRRHYFAEAIVYFFNMFFSTFYHACDSSSVYQYCMLKYDTLGYADFLMSILSFWVTLMAMSRLHPNLHTVMLILGVLCIAISMDFDRHGLWESIVPIFGGFFILIISWALVWFRRRRCFPSKWRYIKFLLPGFLLAVSGLVVFSFFETQQNYLYTHSVWHVVMSLAIIFLLPPRKRTEKERIDALVVNCPSTGVETLPVLSANMADAGSLDRDSPTPLFPDGRTGSNDNLLL